MAAILKLELKVDSVYAAAALVECIGRAPQDQNPLYNTCIYDDKTIGEEWRKCGLLRVEIEGG